MGKYLLTIIILFLSLHTKVAGQKMKFQQINIGFYNCENLYDTIDNTLTWDEDFTLKGDKHYTGKMYAEKLEHIAEVFKEMSLQYPPYGAMAIGLAEIENDTVLNDLIVQKSIQHLHYHFIHFDSKDRRGVDVAFLYNPSLLQIARAEPIFVAIPSGTKQSHTTRDILHVEAFLGGEKIHFFINHWPSRLGGSEASFPARAAAAAVLRKRIASIQSRDSAAKIIVMGDFNDNPSDRSIKEQLIGDSSVRLFNTFEKQWQQGIGTLAYQDAWGLFDQIILSRNWQDKEQKGFFFWYSKIFNPLFLQESKGRFKGYPKRFFGTNEKTGGYSDHFPVIATFLKRAE